VCKKIDYKFSTVCEKNEKISGPLGGGFFFDSHCMCVFIFVFVLYVFAVDLVPEINLMIIKLYYLYLHLLLTLIC